jgi:abortive infection bacteriophage resistance protein
MARYQKPWKSFEDLLDQLIARGMTVTDRSLALENLSKIGYYRLSGYWYAFRERTGELVLLDAGRKPARVKSTKLAADEFKPGASFQNAVDLYVFDKKLRGLVMDALERIEIALRVDITHTLSAMDPCAYARVDLLHGDFSGKINPKTGISRHKEWLTRHDQLVSRSREDSIQHHKINYGPTPPMWIAAEIWDFGTMSTLFGGMREAEQNAISTKYGISNGRVFASWLRSLNYLRNVCAHHSRLWNRNIIDQPRLPPIVEAPWVAPFLGNTHALARCFLLLCITRHVMRVISPRSTWPQRMKQHLQDFPPLSHMGLNNAGMGMHANWIDTW